MINSIGIIKKISVYTIDLHLIHEYMALFIQVMFRVGYYF